MVAPTTVRPNGALVIIAVAPAAAVPSSSDASPPIPRFGLFRLEVHRRKGRERRSGESSVKAHASAEARGVEEGQGELVVLHGRRALSEKKRVRTRSPEGAWRFEDRSFARDG